MATATEKLSGDDEILQTEEQVVTPWEVSTSASGGIDYDKLIAQFGCQKLTDDMVKRVERLTTRPAHPFLKRGIFFAHR